MPANFYAITLWDVAAWPPGNYAHPSETRDWLPAFAIVWQAVTTVLALGRLYLRLSRKAGAFGLDDAFLFMGWFFSIGLTVVACLEGYLYGVNRHTWDVPPQLYERAALCGWLAQVLFLLSTFGTKMAVLLFYRRMVKDSVSRAWLYTLWFFLGVTVCAYIAEFIIYMNICHPLEAYWGFYRIGGFQTPFYCIDGQQLDLSIMILLGMSDTWSVVIPLMMLRHYQLDVTRRQKIALNMIFCLGFLATGAGVARSYWLWKIGHESDIFWAGFNLYVWSLVECHLGIICACLPSLRAFFRYYFGDPARRTYGTASSYNSRNSRQLGGGPGRGGPNGNGTNLSASANRDSHRWSNAAALNRQTKDSWHTEMSAVRVTTNFSHKAHDGANANRPWANSPSPVSPREHNYSPDITLYPKRSVEELGV